MDPLFGNAPNSPVYKTGHHLLNVLEEYIMAVLAGFDPATC